MLRSNIPKPFKRRSLSSRARRERIKNRLLGVAVILFFGGIIGVTALIGWFSRDLPDPNKLIDRVIPLSTKIYDRTGTHLLYEVHGEKQRTLVSIEELPSYLKWATITVEDKDFYSHQGFDLKGILRAIAIDVIRGRKAQGGSTITQQFIKNSLLSSKKEFSRKVKELILAYQIEKRFTKDQILQLYFNEVPYGSTAYGVQSAAEMYFGKDVKTLTLAEAAILAALPKAPTYYSPWGNNRDKLIARQQKILKDMVSEGHITREEAESARTEKLKFKEPGNSITAPHFVIYVKELLTQTYGEKLVEEGGLRVITTIDYDKQQIAEKAVEAGAKKNAALKASNAALVSLDAKTGEMLAMVGSRDYFDETIDGNVNVVLRRRQPGSSFKPIVYATAFSRGYTPKTTIFDLVTNFTTDPAQKAYMPHNYTSIEYGPVSMKKALAGSLNIAAVKTLYLAGVSNVIQFAKNLGYTSLTDPDRYGLALVLGGAEVTLLEHVAAFTGFAREGVVVKPSAILRVEDKDGRSLEEFKPRTGEQAFDAEIARQINDILSDNTARAYIFGAKNHLTLPDRPSAAKTGTTNDYRDAWTIGYTPSVVTGVWVGNNNNAEMSRGADGSKVAAPIWNQYMRETLKSTPVEQFTKPQDVSTGKGVLDGALGEEIVEKVDMATGLPASEGTPPDLIAEKVRRSIHSILYYVDKENPRGPAPERPENDSQFAVWEEGVRKWAEKNHFEEPVASTSTPVLGSMPAGGTQPAVTILSPQENDTITADSLQAIIQAYAPRGVYKASYYLDDLLVGTYSTAPFELSYPLTARHNGFHTLKVTVADDIGNTQSASVTVNILRRK